MGNPQSSDRILGGNLETMGLQATLKMLSLGEKTGQLTVTVYNESNENHSTLHEHLDVYIRRGEIVALQPSNIPNIDFLEILRLLQRIHRTDVQSIRAEAGDQLPFIVQTLVERGIITQAEQRQRIEFMIIQEIARALRWDRGTFEFQTNVKVANDTTLTPISVDYVLLEAIRMVDEWQRDTFPKLLRSSTPRWLPDFQGNVQNLNLSRDDINVLLLSNGQIPIYAIAYGLLQTEARVAASVSRLIDYQLIEVVDDELERQLEHHLSNVLAVSQKSLKQDNRLTPEQRLQMVIQAMGICINKLLSHHAIFARALRGRGPIPDAECMSYLETVFLPILRRIQRDFQVIEPVTFHDAQIDYNELVQLHTILKGEQLDESYWEIAQAFDRMMNETFQMIIMDEIGPTRASRKFNELWDAFAQEINGELERHRVRRLRFHPRRA